ncbi:uncharacterized protein LOC107647687 [Arachis ipaensis]|uniref:uncharacterized protein LOC107647687 n=1 Tax=Arachis ipaensis TaxID=130454 RepID=UPI0007AFDED1|nr:uncharacterized protein LOC107647687 [Arachis ipaensis]
MNYFLGIEAVRNSDQVMTLCQTKYIKELLVKVGMQEAKAIPTLMASSLKLSVQGGELFQNPAQYRSVVGGLQYATITRPEISYAVNKVSQFMHQLLDNHWKAVKQILGYLAGTLQHGLRFQKSDESRIYALTDSDWGSDVDDRKSTSGFCVFYGPNLVSWSSRKQHVISRSSTEAEYIGIAAGLAEVIWLQNLLNEMRIPCTTKPNLYCDS